MLSTSGFTASQIPLTSIRAFRPYYFIIYRVASATSAYAVRAGVSSWAKPLLSVYALSLRCGNNSAVTLSPRGRNFTGPVAALPAADTGREAIDGRSTDVPTTRLLRVRRSLLRRLRTTSTSTTSQYFSSSSISVSLLI